MRTLLVLSALLLSATTVRTEGSDALRAQAVVSRQAASVTRASGAERAAGRRLQCHAAWAALVASRPAETLIAFGRRFALARMAMSAFERLPSGFGPILREAATGIGRFAIRSGGGLAATCRGSS